jgi:hypothetical protein
VDWSRDSLPSSIKREASYSTAMTELIGFVAFELCSAFFALHEVNTVRGSSSCPSVRMFHLKLNEIGTVKFYTKICPINLNLALMGPLIPLSLGSSLNIMNRLRTGRPGFKSLPAQ